MSVEAIVSPIAHTIQLAVAPVFLLTGIGSFLGVMTARLSRIVDRARTLHSLMDRGMAQTEHYAELRDHSRRARLIGWAIGLCTLSALLVAAIIVILFLGAFGPVDAAVPVAAAFVAAMLALMSALVLFLNEIYMGTVGLRLVRNPETRAEPGSGSKQ